MNKKTIISIITLSLYFCLGVTKIASAEEGIMLISETEGTPIVTSNEPDVVEGIINLEDIDDSNEPATTIDLETISDEDSELNNDIIHNGTSGEPLVVCADTNESGCEDEAVDPEMWPLYLSLGALGATILLVIVINLIGRHKK